MIFMLHFLYYYHGFFFNNRAKGITHCVPPPLGTRLYPGRLSRPVEHVYTEVTGQFDHGQFANGPFIH